MDLRVAVANLIWFLHSSIRAKKWRRGSKNVEATQNDVLRHLISENAETEFGREHSSKTIDSTEAFQKAVPIRTYEDFLPYIDAIAEGTPEVLTKEPVSHFGVSSGSVSASKLIPYTSSLISDFQEGIDPWMYHLMKDHPRILGGKTYWSVTPVGENKKFSPGGIPIGFDDERSYFGRLTQWVMESVMVAPSELALIQNMDVFKYATLRFLLQEKSLSWISVWNPSFLTLLLSPLQKWFDILIEDIRTGSLSVDLGVTPEADVNIRRALKRLPKRAEELSLIQKERDDDLYEKIWPNLNLISCWAHGNSEDAVRHLRKYFPNTSIQPKGLIATEAFVSFPFQREASALSINSHFFEFEEVGSGTIKLAHQLETGKKYSLIITTSGGLYRYRLYDIIEVLEFENECPLIRFVGKQDKTVDICGEKLNEEFVSSTIKEIIARHSIQLSFWMVAPLRNEDDVHYVFFVQYEKGYFPCEEEMVAINEDIDSSFRENFHYDYCRRLGQLGRGKIFLVETSCDAFQTYLTTCQELGQRLGDIKPVALHSYQFWSKKFRGRFI